MENWLAGALVALALYGFWGFFPKLAVGYIDPRSALVYEVLGALAVGGLVLAKLDCRPQSHPLGILFSVLTGIAGMTGTLFYFNAASKGRISVVVSLTALYPLVTIILAALFLREPITPQQWLGMACAVLAIFLLSA